jgi:uncharacterized small protein (DUF1192 family)
MAIDISNLLGKYARPLPAAPEITPEVKPTPVFGIRCDICEKELTKFEVKELKSNAGKTLKLCSDHYDSELAASKEIPPEVPEYQTWPTCSKCGAHAKQLLEENPNNPLKLCSTCLKDAARNKSNLVGLKATDSNKYQEFFNQTVEHIKDMSVEDVRAFIIATQEDIFSVEAELLRKKTAKQAAQIKFNKMIATLSLDEQNKLRIEDSTYVPKGGAPKALKSPLVQKEKNKKVQLDLKGQLTSLFGDKLTPEEMAERMKKLGL